MPTYRSVDDFIQALGSKQIGIQRSIRLTSQQLADEAKAYAKSLLMGTMSYEEMKALEHPYARAAPGEVEPLPINIHSARLLNSLRVMQRNSANGTGWYLFFTAPYAKYVLALEGTRYMIERGFWQAMNEWLKKRSAQVARDNLDATKSMGEK